MQCRELKADRMHRTTRCCTGMPRCEASRELVINSQCATRNRGELTVNSRLDNHIKGLGVAWSAGEASCAPTSYLGAHSRTGGFPR